MPNDDLTPPTLPEIPDEPAYEVGYKKPPQHSRFQPGQSGNPKGRPKGARGVHTILEDIVRERVTVTQNGTTQRISKREFILRQVVKEAMKANLKALDRVLPLLREVEAKAESQKQSYVPTEADREVVATLLSLYTGRDPE